MANNSTNGNVRNRSKGFKIVCKKYFFFDIDGTLTDLKTHQIVPSAKIALEKLKQAGHFVCLNTGRAHYKAEKARLEFNFEHMVCNGG